MALSSVPNSATHQLCPFGLVIRYSTSLALTFLIFKMRIIIPTSESYCRDQEESSESRMSSVSGRVNTLTDLIVPR